MDLISRSLVACRLPIFHFSSLPLYIHIDFIYALNSQQCCVRHTKKWMITIHTIPIHRSTSSLFYYRWENFVFQLPNIPLIFLDYEESSSLWEYMLSGGAMMFTRGALLLTLLLKKKITLQKFSPDIRVSNPESAHSTAIHCCRLLKM